MSCTISRFLNFHVSHLNHETFKLCLQNTLNMSKTTRVYFGILHITTKKKPSFLQKSKISFQKYQKLTLFHFKGTKNMFLSIKKKKPFFFTEMEEETYSRSKEEEERERENP